MGQSSTDRGLSRSCCCIAAAAIFLIVFRYCGVASAAEPAPSIEGAWEGRYVCAQGPTGASLTIKASRIGPGFRSTSTGCSWGGCVIRRQKSRRCNRITSRSRRNFAFMPSRRIRAFRPARSS